MSDRGDVEQGAGDAPCTVYLHAGFHKTGTTTFQTFVERNRARHPAAFAFHGKWSPPCARLHNAVVAHCDAPGTASRQALARAARVLATTIAEEGRPLTLVSLESLCGTMPRADGARDLYPFAAEILSEVAAAFAPTPVTLFFSTRAPETWTKSVHKHLVKSRGLNVSLDVLRTQPKFHALDWNAVIAHATRHLACRTQAASMEHDAAGPFGPGATFLSLIGLNDETLATWTPPTPQNRGLNDKTIAALQTRPLTLMPAAMRKKLAKAIDRFV